MSIPMRIVAIVAGTYFGVASLASADNAAESGRKILDANKNAVITVELVLTQKFSFQGGQSQENEIKTETTGTVISDYGLTVVSLSETDPSSIMNAIMADSQRRNMTIDIQVKDAKLLLVDDTEVPAEVILRDKDLDMAFIRPTEQRDEKFAFVDMAKAGKPQLLDQVITLNRLGKVARRVHSASIERIDAVVERPRLFYVPGKDPTNTALGSPAFTLDGEIVGVFLIRAIKDTSGGGRGLFGGMGDNVIAVIVPAADVVEGAAQVPPYGGD